MEFVNKEESNVDIVEPSPVEALEPEVVPQETVKESKEVVANDVDQTIEESCQKLEQSLALEAPAESTKPWYLSSVLIYSLVKNAVASIPHSTVIFEKTQQALCSATSYINKSTSLNVVLEVEECNAMITKLDGTLAGLLVRVDDGFDSLREKLGESISLLIAAITSHKAWAEGFAAKKLSEVNETSTVVTAGIQSRYEQTMELIRAALALARANFPVLVENFVAAKAMAASFAADTKSRAEAGVESAKVAAAEYKEKVTTAVNDTKVRAEASLQAGVEDVQARASTLEANVRTAAARLLEAVQPYVHYGVSRSSSYVDRAVEISQPYVAAAKPYYDPVVARATELNSSLTENKTVGPYVTQVEEAAASLLDSAKTYCTPAPTPAEEVAAEGTAEATIRV